MQDSITYFFRKEQHMKDKIFFVGVINILLSGSLFASIRPYPQIVKQLNQGNYTQDAVLVGTGNSGGGLQGTDLALSADGTTLAIGSRTTSDEDTGAVWIYVQSNGTWTQQQCITPSDELGAGGFGAAVSLSATGNLLAVGGPLDNPSSHSDRGVGAVWLYQRSGNTWTEQQKIIPTDAIGNAIFGRTVSLSPDGTLLATGGTFDNDNIGAVWIYSQNSGIWTEQQKISGESSLNFGFNVVLQTNSLLAVSAPAYVPQNSTMPGTVWLFEESNGQWNEVIALKGPVGEEFGVGLAMSNDTLVVGSPLHKNGTGEVKIYSRSGNIWSETQKLHGHNEDNPAQFGYSTAISQDSSTIAVGEPSDNSNAGSTWIFKKIGTAWKELQKISSSTPNGLMGLAVALSSDGSLLAIGQPYTNSTGETLIFSE
jgi:hypothetical protein